MSWGCQSLWVMNHRNNSKVSKPTIIIEILDCLDEGSNDLEQLSADIAVHFPWLFLQRTVHFGGLDVLWCNSVPCRVVCSQVFECWVCL